MDAAVLSGYVIAATQLVLTLSLVPTLVDAKAKVHWATSLMTASGLFIVGISFMGLSLYLPASMYLLGATMWLLLFAFRRE